MMDKSVSFSKLHGHVTAAFLIACAILALNSCSSFWSATSDDVLAVATSQNHHQISKRSKQQTIVFIQKRRRLVVKCCGKRRCAAQAAVRKVVNGTRQTENRGHPKKTTVGKHSDPKQSGNNASPGQPAALAGFTAGEENANNPTTEVQPGAPPAVEPLVGGTNAPENLKNSAASFASDATTTNPDAPPANAHLSESSPAANVTNNSAVEPNASVVAANNGTTTSQLKNSTTLTKNATFTTNVASMTTTSATTSTLTPTRTTTTTTTTLPPCINSSNYTLSTDKQTWANARLECKKKGMDLVNIEKPTENVCIMLMIEKAGKNDTIFWQALNKIGQSNYTKWLSGEELTFNDWNTGEPANFSTEHCVGIKKGKWVDADCLVAFNYICEKPQPDDRCQNGTNFTISSDKQTFDIARQECLKKNMDLVRVDTIEENICIQRQLAAEGLAKTEVWLGLTKASGQNFTAWIDGKPLTYTDWDIGNLVATENCAMFYNHHWNYKSCSSTLRYLCEPIKIIDPCENMANIFVISNDTLPWAKARIKCKELGMDLASLETEEENNCVKSLLKTAGRLSDVVWHSLNMLGSPDFTHWVNGAPLTYKTGWAKGNPAQFPKEACGGFEYAGKWGDHPCSNKNYYICENNQKDPCVQGQFVVYKEKMTYDNAVIECKKKGMQLAVAESLVENKCLHLALAEEDILNEWVYIGLHRRGETNFTKWINNAPLNYTEWLPGQPEPILWEVEQCVMTWLGHWSNVGCIMPLFFVCETAKIYDPCKALPSNYSVSTDLLSWGQARVACKKLGMDLVSIETDQENECVKEKIEFAGKVGSIVFTALNKMGLKDYTTWPIGSAVTINGWGTGEPAQRNSENCGAFKDGKWIDTLCIGPNPYVCESPVPADVCKKYKFNITTDTKYYDDARFECLKRKMSIASLETVEKNMCLMQYLTEAGYGTSIVFIGLDKRGQTNFTKWDNGEPLTYDDWEINGIEDPIGQLCAVAQKHHWYDAPCSLVQYPYVCEDKFIDPCIGFANYSISKDLKSWPAARDECKKIGGDLVSLETPKENYCLKYILYINGQKDIKIWHSLNHIGTQYFTHWSNGEPLTYNGFVQGYNTKAYSRECCAGFESGAWGSGFPCQMQLPYVCEFNPAPKEICKLDQFVLSAETQTFKNAVLKCKEKGMELASLETSEENMCAQRHLMEQGHTASMVYMSLNKIGGMKVHKWINDAPLNYTTGWFPTEPSQPSEECAIFEATQWYDMNCAAATRYLCEK